MGNFVHNVAVKGPKEITNNLTPCIQVVLKCFAEEEVKEENMMMCLMSDSGS